MWDEETQQEKSPCWDVNLSGEFGFNRIDALVFVLGQNLPELTGEAELSCAGFIT